jgi:hypothetical protein
VVAGWVFLSFSSGTLGKSIFIFQYIGLICRHCIALIVGMACLFSSHRQVGSIGLTPMTIRF